MIPKESELLHSTYIPSTTVVPTSSSVYVYIVHTRVAQTHTPYEYIQHIDARVVGRPMPTVTDSGNHPWSTGRSANPLYHSTVARS